MFFSHIIYSILLLTSCYTSQTEKPPKMTYHNGRCTKGTNNWSVSSSCNCHTKFTYDKRTGFCFPKNSSRPTITVAGKINSGIIAIGAETTGFNIKNNKETYELILKQDDKKLILENPNQLFKIVGEKALLPSLERTHRQVIIVQHLLKKMYTEKN